MPLFIVRSDITKMKVDAIVNAANNSLLGGGGVDGAIHRAAGRGLLEECRTLGGCETGDAKATRGYDLPAKYVIHTVGPVWRGGERGEARLLASCYRRSLEEAERLGCQSVAFPLISAGVYGYPKAEAFRIAHDTILEHIADSDLTAYIVLFDEGSVRAAAPNCAEIKQYIDEHYVYAHSDAEPVAEARKQAAHAEDAELAKGYYLPAFLRGKKKNGLPMRPAGKPAADANAAPPAHGPDILFSQVCIPPDEAVLEEEAYLDDEAEDAREFSAFVRPAAMEAKQEKSDLEGLLGTIDESFSQMLLRKIDERGMKDSECYKRANVDRRLFSKIRSNPHYRPGKPTALAFAVALRLPLDETRELLMKAGFALSNSSKFDLIVRWYIERGCYDVHEINRTLFVYDQPLLGNVG